VLITVNILSMNDTAAPPTSTGMSLGLIQLMRLKQWVKNGFVLAPLVFAGQFLNVDAVTDVLIATLLFCLASSATYIINDIQDVDSDRKHPQKSLSRPIASGTVSVPMALTLLAMLYAILIAAAFWMPGVMAVIAAYAFLNIAYTFYLKHQPVVDIFTIAIGFVLRVYAGAMALSVPVSSWMFITTLCLALFLAAVKRRQELSQSGNEGRQVLKKYTVGLVDRYAEMSATAALLFYSMFVMSSRPVLVVTVPLVLFGLFRYWYVVDALERGESPTDALLSDWPLLLTVLMWVGVCAWAVWPSVG
jgi:decaprenyl-phosphate phosphoribosyltransferase